MPATPWHEIPKGQRCEVGVCPRYATHFYGSLWMCCECHAGPDGGLVSDEVAAAYHEGSGEMPLIDEEGVLL